MDQGVVVEFDEPNKLLVKQICDLEITPKQFFTQMVQTYELKTLMQYQSQDNKDTSLANSKCVSICSETSVINQKQNICSKSYECSTQYTSISSMSKGQVIKSIYASNITDDIFFVYNNFINAINSKNGAFIRQYTFDSSIITTYQFRDSIFLFGNNKNSIFKWNPRDNIIQKVLEIGKGTLKTSSQIMEVENNSNILLVTSIDNNIIRQWFIKQSEFILFLVMDFNAISCSEIWLHSKFYKQQQILTIQYFQALIFNGQPNQNQLSILMLNSNSQVTHFVYILNLSNNGLEFKLQKSQQIPSYILNPQQLLVANGIVDSQGQSKNLNLVFLTYQNSQIINITDSSLAGVVIDFQAKLFQNQQKVNKIVYFKTPQLIVSCGSDGKVIVWQAVDLQQPVFFYQLSKSGQQCIDFQIFQVDSLIVQYQNEVNIFNIFNPLDSYSYPILNSAYTKIQVLQDHLFILNGNTIFIFKQKELIYYKDQIPIIFQLNPNVSIYQSTNKILKSFMLTSFDSLIGNLLLINDSNNNIIVLDMKFQQKIIKSNQIGYILKVYQYDDNKLFLIVQVLNPNNYNQFQYGFAYYDLSTNELLYIASNSLPIDITQIYQDVLQDGSYQYQILLVNSLGYTSYSVYMIWNKNKNIVTYEQLYYTPGQNQVACQGDLSENYIVVGSQIGEVRVLQLESKLGPQKVYQSFLLSDNVQSVYQSFKIGLYFIITNYQIKCFSIHTDQLIEIISFQTIKTPPDSPCVKNITIAENLQILIAYTTNELVLKNFSSGQFSSILLNMNNQIYLSFVNGVYIDENYKEIYIYGDFLVKTDLLLQNSIKIDSQNANGSINQCVFTSNSVFCSKNHMFILIYQRNNNLFLFSTITVSAEFIGFQLMIDLDYQNIIVFTQLRRYNRKDRISDIHLLSSNIIIVVFTTRIESAYIDISQNVINSIESVQLTDPKIALIELLISQQFIHLIGVSQNSIFEKYLSFGIFSSLNSSVNTQQCISSLTITEDSNTFNQLDIILNQSASNMKYKLSVLVGEELKQLDFLNNINIQVILRPKNTTNNNLTINSSTFQYYPIDIYMDNFNFVFNQQNIQIGFNQNTNVTTLQNISIVNQTISGNTSLVFENKQTVIIQNLKIQNVNFTGYKNNLTQNQINPAFIIIRNCNYVLIQNLTLDKCHLMSNYSQFMQVLNSSIVIQYNFSIFNSQIDGNLFLLQQNQNVTFQSTKIEKCTKSVQNPNQINLGNVDQSTQNTQTNFYLFNFMGIMNLLIQDYIAQDNIELLQIYTSRQFEQSSGILSLNQDNINIKNLTLINNIFPTSFNENQQIYLINIQNSFVFIDQIQSHINQGNCFISSSITVRISNSLFTQNKGALGGSLYFSDIMQYVQIFNSSFINNTASCSGGAIMVFNVNNFEIDYESLLSNNQAQIGGGLRIISSSLKTNQQQQKTEVINCHFQNNQGYIYGNNVGRYPSQLQIYLQNSQEQTMLLGEQDIQNYQTANTVLISELQSGGNVILNIKLLDSENKIFSINVDRYITNNYPKFIQDELSQYLIEISQSTQNQYLQSQNNQIAQIKGQSLISAKQFNQTTGAFSFQTLSLSYIPLQSTDSLSLKLIISNQYQSMLIPLNLQFRQCIRGEIPIKQFSFIVICQECLPGTYSLLIPDQNSSNTDTQDYECKKCPEFSVSCSQDQIILEAGYWRINQQSDQIIACNQQYPDICNEADQSSKFGCIQGYMGPLCETCDYLGTVWKESYQTEIPLNFQNISQLDNFSVHPNIKFEDTPQNFSKSKFYFKQNKERETLWNNNFLKDSDKNILEENTKVSQTGYQKKNLFSLATSSSIQNNNSISPFKISKAQPIVNQEIFFAQNQNQIEQSQSSDITDDIFQFEENRPVQVVNNTMAFEINKLNIKNIVNSDLDK
ncbi:transmembrane protein (macronuclear) [Tetrahymena thermophila SB210]|uniref:Transmembrane protein n=1 Tax=Tetrahymena thermophila (strain SB210) TaxID=312017 RepID=I7M744_TETTS|nr:transmembrane protein [Tetrahymena thermophila SB210]EAR89349.2 transmembrane protein [Tetrahymena thermophila SB210]|eukprot:XP_001009594.2 transmembrane protein [Tetrahymena thermophila SB210]